jgi:predicted TIM-barrel fold metal-dependent hydrolase
MASLPFVDTHVHFHDLREPSLVYAWLRPEDPSDDPDGLGAYGAIKAERYHADDFLAETRFANVEAVVHVQAAIGTPDPAEETRWLQAFADRLGVPQGIVASCDLGAPDAAEVLARHAGYANLRGIRDLRYDGYLTDEAWLRGLPLLAERGLVWCDDPLVGQMAIAAEVARRHPELTLCVDHAGYPRGRDDASFREWRAGMAALAAVPSTVVKISGLGMADHRWTVASLRPWVETCLELWGTERAFFGTNWPVDRLFSSYGDVVDAYAELVADLPDAEQAALFSGNARRVFRLG